MFRCAEAIAAELAERERFFGSRFDRVFARDELRDVTNVLLGTPATLLRCAGCEVLIREAPGEASFRDDRYDDGVLTWLHDAHAAAFRAKEADYRSLLPRDARIVEIGSYAGGFLRVASEWGWRATGIDIGRDVTRFSRRLGFDAREECELRASSLDGVFVWNCFEQMAAPATLLAEAHRALRRDGLLVIRVPDAAFYIERAASRVVLAYNSLLGWPHRFGFGAGSLRRLASVHGFALRRVLHAPAMRPLREAMSAWARAEEGAVMTERNYGWIELTFRAEEGRA